MRPQHLTPTFDARLNQARALVKQVKWIKWIVICLAAMASHPPALKLLDAEAFNQGSHPRSSRNFRRTLKRDTVAEMAEESAPASCTLGTAAHHTAGAPAVSQHWCLA